jgi:hypothetical protein
MAPEQAEGKKEIGPAVDVYALGAILYDMLTGRPPFVGVTIYDIIEQVKNHEPLPFVRLRIRVPRDLETICMKCLRKDPKERYSSAGELAEDLRRFLDGRAIVARPIGFFGSMWLWCHRPERVHAAGVFTAALGITLILWNLYAFFCLACGWFPHARPSEAIPLLGGFLGLVYIPLVLVGIRGIKPKVSSLWLGLGLYCFGFLFCGAMASYPLASLPFDFGGLYPSPESRVPTFCLLNIICLIGMLLYVAALLAYYSNRELMDKSRSDIRPAS